MAHHANCAPEGASNRTRALRGVQCAPEVSILLATRAVLVTLLVSDLAHAFIFQLLLRSTRREIARRQGENMGRRSSLQRIYHTHHRKPQSLSQRQHQR